MLLRSLHGIRNERGTEGDPGLSYTPTPPGPLHREQDIVLQDGVTLRIRHIREGDQPALCRFYQSLSSETVFFRFGQWRLTMSPDRLVCLCSMNQNRDLAFVAVLPGEKETVIGEVRLNRLPDPQSAELSFVIADSWQGKGVGGLLMDFCLAAAKEVGLKTLVMEVMKKNIRMICFAWKYHFQQLPGDADDDMAEMQLELAEDQAAGKPLLADSSAVKRERQVVTPLASLPAYPRERAREAMTFS